MLALKIIKNGQHHNGHFFYGQIAEPLSKGAISLVGPKSMTSTGSASLRDVGFSVELDR